jgi:hypothetical protein
MPSLPPRKTLVVHLHLWSSPRYTVVTQQGQEPCRSLPKAREYAEQNGYTSLRVIPK